MTLSYYPITYYQLLITSNNKFCSTTNAGFFISPYIVNKLDSRQQC